MLPFGPVNLPVFYKCMIGNFKAECDALFIKILTAFADTGVQLDGASVTIQVEEIFHRDYKLYSGTRSIINDISIWYSIIPAILI